MKYKTVKVASHPRSGSHWVMRLIDMNFFDGKDYLKHYGGHPFGNEPRSKGYFKPNQAVIYTWRTIDDAVRSIYKMRHRFGLDEDNYETFCVTPMKKMYNPNLKVVAVRDTLTGEDKFTDVDWLFRSREETPKEYIEKHRRSWQVHTDKPNFLAVCYDDLVVDFQGTMLRIAHFLGSNKTEFVDENRRVGWREKSDNGWQKPKTTGTDSND